MSAAQTEAQRRYLATAAHHERMAEAFLRLGKLEHWREAVHAAKAARESALASTLAAETLKVGAL